ncbi:hypothetical protein BR93DRAFT_971016 [Coniochaeta sp. PMI_546]|nr:hypothetical protein BR93DRAFT_971016 [Coniochaeta sp. PMI_546]
MHKPTFIITFIAAFLASATPLRTSTQGDEPVSRSDRNLGNALSSRANPPPGKSALHLWDNLTTSYYLALAVGIIIDILAVQPRGSFPIPPAHHVDRDRQVQGGIAQAARYLADNADTEVVNRSFGPLVISLSHVIPIGRNPSLQEWDTILTSAFHRLEHESTTGESISVSLGIEGYGVVTLTINTPW